MCPCPVQGGTLMSPAVGSISGQRVSPEDHSRICPQSKEPLHTRSHTLPRVGRVDGGLTLSPQSKAIPALESPTALRHLCHNCITAQNLPLLCPASLISFRYCFWKCIPSKKSAHRSKSQSVFSRDLTYTCLGGEEANQKLPLWVMIHVVQCHLFNGRTGGLCCRGTWYPSLVTASEALADLQTPSFLE